jgi:hypothetical protein
MSTDVAACHARTVPIVLVETKLRFFVWTNGDMDEVKRWVLPRGNYSLAECGFAARNVWCLLIIRWIRKVRR